MKDKGTSKMTGKRVLAMAGVVLLVALYLVTLGVALLGGEGTGRLLIVCLAATVAVPVLIWIYTWVYSKFTGKKTIASDPSDGTDENNN